MSLEKGQKLTELSALVKKYTHQLGNLLVGIVGNGELLVELDGMPEEAREMAAEMLECAQKASDLSQEFQRQALLFGAPALGPVIEKGPVAEPEPPKELSIRSVMVVDDQDVVRSLSRTLLERAGFQVSMAASLNEAVKQLEEGIEVGCFLLDLTLPGSTPEEAVVKLRHSRPDARLVVISGFSEADARQRLGQHPISGFLQKPFFAEDLINAVKAGAGGKAQGSASENAGKEGGKFGRAERI